MKAKIKFIALASSLLVSFIGLTVLIGWIFHIQRMYQLIPDTTPMQFNAALCFLMAGIGFTSLNIKFPFRTRVIQLTALWIIIFGTLTVLEYVFEISLGIDQLFFKPYLTLGTAFPGRMAPNTALGFVLVGFGLLLIRFNIRHYLGIFTAQLLSTLVGCLGVSALAGYVFGFDGSYGWGNFSRMAPLTATAVSLLSVSGWFNMMDLNRKSMGKRKDLIPIFSALVVLASTLILWQATLKLERKRIAEQVSLQAETFGIQIHSVLVERTKGLERMASRWQEQGRTPEKLWRTDAKNYIHDLVGMSVVGWVDGNSTVKLIEPHEKFKYILGYNFLTEENRKNALTKAKNRHQATMTETIELLQGGKGFLIFVPVWINEKYDGVIYGAFRYQDFFESIISFNGFAVTIKQGKDVIFKNGDTSSALTKDWKTNISIKTNEITWDLELLPTEQIVRARTTYLPLFVLIIGSFVSFLVGILIQLFQNARTSEKVLKIAVQKAEAATLAKSQFLANMSHEIRTPLNGVIGMTHLMQDTPLNTEQKSYLDTIHLSAETLLTVINDVLDFSKIEAGKLDFEEIDFNLAQVVHEVKRTVEFSAEQKGLKLQIETQGMMPDFFKGDPSRLKQVIINLLSNSIKFTLKGSITLRITNVGSQTKIEIQDTGVGIAPEAVPHLFKAFTQADATTTRRFGGTGLGLSISKKLVELMGGVMGVESELGKGSTFWFSIPFKKSDKQITNTKVEKVSIPDEIKGARILLAEDNIVNQKIAVKMIEQMGFKVNAVANGIEVLDSLRSFSYDLILMDCQMPEMDGYEATQKVRSSKTISYPNIPIVAMTANAVQGDREKCLEAGMNDYITKPINASGLQAIIVKNLNNQPKNKKQA